MNLGDMAGGAGKVIAAASDARPLLDAARVAPGDGVIVFTGGLASGDAIARFIAAAKRGRIWSREAAAHGLAEPPAQPTGANRPAAPNQR
jgi:antitoxin (DNA-binding transcriptional repressor) of toxin-antitoxin stability system